jgi:hypothetical protein
MTERLVDLVLELDPDWCEIHECATVHSDDVLRILTLAPTPAPLDDLRSAALRVIEESILAPERDVVRVSIEAWRGLNAALAEETDG